MRSDFSVGGVVTDPDGRVALIRTTNLAGAAVWGLPKGHPKAGETDLDAARREAEEETGLAVVVFEPLIMARIEYWFVGRDGERVHKRVDFYRMEAIGGSTDDHDAEVEEVALLDPPAARAALTYENEKVALDEVLG
jgi:ADP-ribose pyrophosphatase YjhB (NUDIX family)